MNETIPWNWQDTATLLGCISLLILAFWIRRRLLRGRPATGCSSGGCGSASDSAPPRQPARVIIPTQSLSIGRRKNPPVP